MEQELKPCPFLYDSEDGHLIEVHRWYVSRRAKHSYVARTEIVSGKKRMIYFHREIMKAPQGLEVDHINGNGLDNRRANLRLVTHAQNLANNRQAPGCSGYKGVWRSHRGKGWVAILKRNGKRICLGTFGDPRVAHDAWLKAARGQ